MALAAGHGQAPRVDPRDCDIALLGWDCVDHAAALAAANPDCRVWLLGPGHDQQALDDWQQLAALENLSLIDCPLTDLPRLLVPEFAIVAIDRLPNAVEATARAALLDWSAGALREGGLLHIAYDALPGAAPLTMLRDIARAVSDNDAGTEARLAQALAYLGALAELEVPLLDAVGSCYRFLLASSPEQRVQRLFSTDWSPLHATDLSAICEAAGLTFAGTTGRLHSAAASSQALELAAAAILPDDPLSLEQHLAFAMNDLERGDIYLRAAHRDREIPPIPVRLLSAAGPSRPVVASDGWQALEQAVAHAGILPAPTAATNAIPAGRHNAVALQRAMLGNAEHVTVAAPGIGGGVTLPCLDALLLTARASAGASGHIDWALDYVDRCGKRLNLAGTTLDDDAARQSLAMAFTTQVQPRLPLYASLGLCQA